MLAFLSLSQRIIEPEVAAETSSRDHIVKAIRDLRQLDPLNFGEASIAHFKETILATQAACHKYVGGRLDEAVVCEILTHVCRNYVWQLFRVDYDGYFQSCNGARRSKPTLRPVKETGCFRIFFSFPHECRSHLSGH
jgi:hypothetical protein